MTIDTLALICTDIFRMANDLLTVTPGSCHHQEPSQSGHRLRRQPRMLKLRFRVNGWEESSRAYRCAHHSAFGKIGTL